LFNKQKAYFAAVARVEISLPGWGGLSRIAGNSEATDRRPARQFYPLGNL
jgi:hypothetical protein